MSSDKLNYKGADYSAFRPVYPAELYDLVYEFHAGEWLEACDMGTGTGQGAIALAERFAHVTGMDRLPDMIDNATRKANVSYKVGRDVDLATLGDRAVDMVTVATAFHWFDKPAFFDQLKRVLKPGGTFATWTYYFPLIKDAPEANVILKEQCTENGPLKSYMDDRVHHVINMYRDISFPFKTVQYYITPESEDTTHISLPNNIVMQKTVTLRHFRNYLKTASCYVNYKNDAANNNKPDPVDTAVENVAKELNKSLDDTVDVQWPLVLVLCRD
ncbi:S-adenosyl-L-methionine-dependent methyltransferase [Gongronella butleri]|nr:S-adenosyl-L-methionine-dependent methyltransferase [Gongronella butleri]